VSHGAPPPPLKSNAKQRAFDAYCGQAREPEVLSCASRSPELRKTTAGQLTSARTVPTPVPPQRNKTAA
jgi:hypothetical protein